MINPFLDDAGTVADEELVLRAQSGDRDALDQLLTRHQPWVFNIAIRMLGRFADAEDATQEVLIRVLKSLHSFRGESKFRTWLYRIAANAAIERRRRRRTVGLDDVHPLGSDALAPTANLDAEVRSGWAYRPAMASTDFEVDPELAAQRRSLQGSFQWTLCPA